MARPAELHIIIAPEAEIEKLSASGLRELFAGMDVVLYCDGLYRPLPEKLVRSGHRYLFPRHVIRVDSREEHLAFENSIEFSAETARHMRPLSVSGIPLGTAVAFDLMRSVRREWMIYQALERMVANNSSLKVAVWAGVLDPALQAALARLELRGSARWVDLVEIHGGRAFASVAYTPLDRLTNAPPPLRPGSYSTNGPRSKPLVLDRSTADTGVWREWTEADYAVAGKQNPVHFFLATKSSLAGLQSRQILAALQAEGHPTRLIRLAAEARATQSGGSSSCQDVAFAQPNADMHGCAQFCAQHLRAAASLAMGDPMHALSLMPLFLPSDSGGFSLYPLLNAALSAKAMMMSEPRSVWVPDVVTSVCQAIIAGVGETPIFSGYAASVSETVRNLLYIDPRVTMLSYGTQIQDIYRIRGIDPKRRVIVTGAPQYDELFASSTRRADERQVLPVRMRILVVTARMHGAAEDVPLLALLRWARVEGHAVAIKHHPSRPGDYSALMQAAGRSGEAVTFLNGASATEALLDSDLVISDASTSSIMAALLRLPLIQLDTVDSPLEYNDLSAFGVALKATSPLSLIRQVQRAREVFPLDTNAYRNLDNTYNYMNDGKAGMRCAEILTSPPPRRSAAVCGLNLILATLREARQASSDALQRTSSRTSQPGHPALATTGAASS